MANDRLPSGWSNMPLSELLGEVDVRVRDLPSEQQNLEVLSLTKRRGLIPQTDRFDKRVATEDIKAYKVVRTGWIVYNPYVIWEGAVHALRRVKPGVVSPAYVVWERTGNDGGFIDLLLRTPPIIQQYERFSAGAVNRRRAISKANFLSIRVPCPPLAEQRRIAAVMSAVQRSIELQAQLIAHTAKFKKALVHTLFNKGTRGEPLKQTEIGSVPESWTVSPLGELCDLLSGGTPSKSELSFWSGRIPWASPKDMKLPRLADTQDHLSQAGVSEGSRLVPRESIFVVIRGMILARDVPIAQTTVPMAFNQDMKALVNFRQVTSDFMLYSLQNARERLLKKVGSSAHGTRTLMTSAIERLPVAVPDSAEQELIARTVGALEDKYANHVRTRGRLQTLFHTLLHKLMTAQIRVNDLDLSSLEAPEQEPVGAV